jgi:formate/nitrite transporter FocA (FNT family)
MKRLTALLLHAILAGICIGLGGTIFLRLKDSFPGAVVIAAFLFSVGLFVISTQGYALYTGKVCYLLDHALPTYLLDLVVVWLGNLFGCMLIAWMESFTTLFGEGGINEAALGLVSRKMSAPYLSLFILGILCNLFIYIAVSGFSKNPHELGKYLALFLGVTGFILAGTEHSIADMYFWFVSGVIYDAPAESLLRILIVTAGNGLGGFFFPLIEKLTLALKRERQKSCL